jgi:hypothetical protein
MTDNKQQPNGKQDEQGLTIITNQFPADKFNSLIPIKSMQKLCSYQKPIFNEVYINPDPNKREVYKEKNGELALTKIACTKLMTAANIQIVSSTPIMPSTCTKCVMMARATGIAQRCGDCPSKDDVAHQVIIAVPEASGQWRNVRGTKELRASEEKQRMSEKNYEVFYQFRAELCETKALLRALRAGLMLKATYTPEELKKPFVVAYIVPDMDDKDIKQAYVARFAIGNQALFGEAPGVGGGPAMGIANQQAGPALAAGPQGGQAFTMMNASGFPGYTVEDAPEDEEHIEGMHYETEQGGHIIEDDDQEARASGEPENICRRCGYEIQGNAKKGWKPEDVINYSKRTFGEPYCMDCQPIIRDQIKKDKEAGK